jgi:hypothetical protein
MSDHAKKDAVSDLVREGAASYLDALYALQRFRQEVTDIAIIVWNRRLPELVSAIDIQGLAPSIVGYHYDPDAVGSEWDGNWAWVTARAWFSEPLASQCHLGLTFDRNEIDATSNPYVTFACTCSKAPTFKRLKSSFLGREHYFDNGISKEVGFCWKLEDPLSLEADLNRMMDYVISVWKNIGGWGQLPT